MNETVLISKTESFLKKISEKEIELTNIDQLEEYISLYQYLKENLKQLQDLKDEMENKGYNTPYRSINRFGSNISVSDEPQSEDLYDISHHNQYFRMKATAKKNILDRVYSAISSHKIAIGNLEEYAMIECVKCAKIYRVNDFYDLNDLRCACQSEEFRIMVQGKMISRLELIPFLPLSGAYMVSISKLTPLARDAFKRLLKVLKQERKGLVKTVSLVIRVQDSNCKWVRRRVNMDIENELDYEDKLREKYGKNMRIEFLQIQRKRPAIVNNKHTRTALSLAYSLYSQDLLLKNKKRIYQDKLEDYDKLKKYTQIKKDVDGLEVNDWITEDEDAYRGGVLNDRLSENGLFCDNSLDIGIQRDLKLKEEIKEGFLDVPETLILWDIFKYYLLSSNDWRVTHTGPIPNLRQDLDRKQLKAFDKFDRVAVGIISEYFDIDIVYISDLARILLCKFDIENKMKGLNMKTDNNAFGAAIVDLESDLGLDVCISLFNVSKKSILVEENNIKHMGEPSTNKAKKFMELIKK